jgi:hypothetical protein
MIPKVTYGQRVRGLLEYLWGPGKVEEHTDPHLVAGYDDLEALAPDRHPVDRERCGWRTWRPNSTRRRWPPANEVCSGTCGSAR